MNRLVTLIIFVIIVAILWWALQTVLVALAVPAPWPTLATVAFVVLALLAALDYFQSGTWFFRR